MTMRAIRQKIHDYVETVPDDKLQDLYAALQREADELGGKNKGISDEALERLHQQYREEHPEKVVVMNEDGSYPPGFFEELDQRRAAYYADKSTAISAEEARARIKAIREKAIRDKAIRDAH